MTQSLPIEDEQNQGVAAGAAALAGDAPSPSVSALRAPAANAKVQTLVQFAQERGLVTDYDARSHIHAGLRSAPQTKTYQRWYKSETERLLAAAADTEAKYLAAIEAGEIVAPAPATLEDRANGHPDLASTQAAKRILEKRRAFSARGGQ